MPNPTEYSNRENFKLASEASASKPNKLARHSARQGSDITLQGYTQAAENRESDIPLASLDSAKVGAVHVCGQGKLLLRQADTLTLRPDPVAEFVKGFLLVHRTA